MQFFLTSVYRRLLGNCNNWCLYNFKEIACLIAFICLMYGIYVHILVYLLLLNCELGKTSQFAFNSVSQLISGL